MVLSLVATGLLLSSCSLPQPQADPTRFYILAPSDGEVAASAAQAPALHVRPIELASYMRSRPLIVRKSNNEIEFREFARWGEPLEQGIARVLREELLARGAVSAVTISGVRAANRPADYELAVRVLACEGTADGGVNFRAMWELSAAGDKSSIAARGDYRANELKWDVRNEGALAGRLSQAVAGLAAEIAAAVPKK